MSSTVRGSAGPEARTARRAQTWERLIEAAIGVFAERGVIGASVEEICERAGYTRGAFYSNFAGKDELVLAMLRHFSERDLERVAEVSAHLAEETARRDSDPGALVRSALTRLFRESPDDRNEVLARQEIDLYAIRRPAVRQPYQAYVEQLEHRVADVITEPLQTIGIEFAIDDLMAIRLLHACYAQTELSALLQDAQPDTRPMEELIAMLSRPIETPATPGATG